ncbi:MAG TPA: AAC(3) family N-acetyltransferase [Ignavibacteria bacterium]|nr:AAC(3) family N-acetyltransferase [Ignavibacteria bacterium]
MQNNFAKLLAEKTKDNPAFIHLDFIGLIRLGKTNEIRIDKFCEMLKEIENEGGNICIPAFTLSYTRNEIFNMPESPAVNIGMLPEVIRQKFPDKRTSDGLFSFTAIGNNFSKDNFIPKDTASFGDSLMAEVFEKDGYLASIGGVFRNSTEIHYLEKLLEVDYRSDKIFEGDLIDTENNLHRQKVTYFCKNFDYNLWYDFSELEKELKNEELMEIIRSDDNSIYIEMIKFKTVFEFLKDKIKKDKNYLIRELKDKRT